METIEITKKEYSKLKRDSKIVDVLTKLDEKLAKSILKSLKQATQGKVERVF